MGSFGGRLGVVREWFGNRSGVVNSGVVRESFGDVQGSFRARSGVVRESFGIVQGSFGGRLAFVQGSFENFSKTFRKNQKSTLS